MTENTIQTENHSGTLVIRLNIPDRRNPLTSALVGELREALQKAQAEPEIRATVLTGIGPAFSAGADLQEFSQIGARTPAKLYDDAYNAADLFRLGSQLRKPLIGAINGAAFGGDMGLVAMCHWAVAADTARFGTTELRVGLIPFVILPLIRRAIGEKNALKLMLLAESITAREALQMGLVQKVVPPNQVLEQALSWAKTVGGYSPYAVKMGLDAFFTTQDLDLEASFAYLARLRILSFLSDDLKEGTQAFLEKRAPVWRGQ